MENIPADQLRIEVLRDIGKVCEELVSNQPSLIPSKKTVVGAKSEDSSKYDSAPPYWYHSSLTPHLRERLSLSQSLRQWQFSPDVDFIGLEIDPETKQQVYKLKINFCNWHFLQKHETDLFTSEGLREETRSIVVLILDTVFQTGQKFGYRFVFTEVDLSHTASSTRSIFGGSDSQGNKVRREKEIEVLNLSWTQTSSRSLANFYKATKLSVLILDHCERLRRNKTTESSSVLSLLATHQIPTLKVLSLVGTSNMLSSRWMLHVEKGCPNLETIYFTRKPGEKAIGWDDVIKMQTMRDPCLIPECGHIADYETLVATRFVCSFDRNITTPNDIIKLSPNITKISRKNNASWIAEIVDHNRETLDDKSLYHVVCGEFYNFKTLVSKYHVKFSSISEDLIKSLKGKHCFNCEKEFEENSLRVVFTQSAKMSNGNEFGSLEKANIYSHNIHS